MEFLGFYTGHGNTVPQKIIPNSSDQNVYIFQIPCFSLDSTT